MVLVTRAKAAIIKWLNWIFEYKSFLRPVCSVTVEGGEVAAGEEGDDDSVDALQLVKVSVLRKLFIKTHDVS